MFKMSDMYNKEVRCPNLDFSVSFICRSATSRYYQTAIVYWCGDFSVSGILWHV